MVKIPPQEEHFVPRAGLSTDEKQRMPVVKIRSVRTPDVYTRLSRAIDILLSSAAAREVTLEKSTNPEKGKKPFREGCED
jgi:hypothetical protein